MSVSAQDKVLADFETKLFDCALGTGHAYRKLNRLINFDEIALTLQKTYSHLGQPGIPAVRGLKAMLLQFWEDYSDREMEAAVRENLAIRWFVGFSLTEKTPDHSYFGKFRKRIGTQHLANIFNSTNDRLQKEGLFGNIFFFIDASTIITKTALWEERDKAIAEGIEKLNNTSVEKFAADTQARFGCKGKSHYWFGYKRHIAACMKQGLITKVAVTPANITEGRALKHICPKEGMTLGDKAYCVQEAQRTLKANGCHSGAILKNNMKKKDFKKDVFLTRLRMPYENIFSKMDKKVRYRGQEKAQFQGFMQALVFNFKRLIALHSPPLFT